jgi:hypothetical protein
MRSVCRPNSAPARDMMRAVVKRLDRPYALYRLGIAAHVFCDTWAHQGFVGFQHKINIATHIAAEADHHKETMAQRTKAFFGVLWDEAKGTLVGGVLPLGHGTVLTYPDRPYLKWSYTNGLGNRVDRNNPVDFYEAARELYQHFKRYITYRNSGLPAELSAEFPLPPNFEEIAKLIISTNFEDEHLRHKVWLNASANGVFGFRDQVEYVDKGPKSWKAVALKTVEDLGDNKDRPIPFPPGFHSSNWKLFHDALQAHRFYILHELLPKYGILSR